MPRGWNIRLLSRAACGSELSSHSVGDSVQLAETFEPQHVSDVVCRMLLECADLNDVIVNCCDDAAESTVLDGNVSLIIREIYYRLLQSPQGAHLQEIAIVDSQSHRIARAIEWLNQHYPHLERRAVASNA